MPNIRNQHGTDNGLHVSLVILAVGILVYGLYKMASGHLIAGLVVCGFACSVIAVTCEKLEKTQGGSVD